ncbi:glyoxalase [Actinophytocola xinjiangensis]|uniref:Glyoxalase n=1 Tax=Actinophytocola xinjiangensis TaxID=485602 RepID=A0A7Z1AXN4_9PSEU|nr:VOC family protein [Actinophytocola xinjiangensis]OLF08024.1 glyoxalase [Actinophytocola xinjiangensis]
MEWTIEVIVVPVSDVDRAKTFYEQAMGFVVDHDTRLGPDTRFVQLTPPGSGCSIVLGAPSPLAPGTLGGVQLVVADLRRARRELAERGVDVGEITFMSQQGSRPATDDDDLNNAGFLGFADPDGNSWVIQQITARA